MITDLGTEIGLAAALQSFFRDNPEAHRFVASPRNQRWRSFFGDLEFHGVVDTSSDKSMERLWYCFNKVLQAELTSVKEHWNAHRIRKSRNNAVTGRPDSLYFLPEIHGARDCLF